MISIRKIWHPERRPGRASRRFVYVHVDGRFSHAITSRLNEARWHVSSKEHEGGHVTSLRDVVEWTRAHGEVTA